MAKAYTCRPSELYGIQHPVQELFFDRAVWLFGTSLEAELEQVTNSSSKSKKPKSQKQIEQARLKVLNKWLGNQAVGFRAPAPTRRSITP